jgi:hypothetical protein
MGQVDQLIKQGLDVVTRPDVKLESILEQQQQIGELRAFQHIQDLVGTQIAVRVEAIKQYES